jgi:hypothetical protein
MPRTDDQKRRVRNSALVLGLFAVLVYVGFIIYSVKGG